MTRNRYFGVMWMKYKVELTRGAAFAFNLPNIEVFNDQQLSGS